MATAACSKSTRVGATRFERSLFAGIFDEDATHGLRRRGEEVSARLPSLRVGNINEPQIGVVNQRRRLQRLARFLTGELGDSKLSQLVIDQRKKLLCSLRLTLLDRLQNLCDSGHEASVDARRANGKNFSLV
jgi:hypothetical protein